ncbi:sensor histidine kinase [Acidipropionibacterium timonense]|uniref:sensor histidine kinase n=1 Tax=Acidipropionibacterium timonense TaxID=2161818 RepID=UPI001436B6D1|nr:ATP-binding protein [Acidipropionibacterium timonense]
MQPAHRAHTPLSLLRAAVTVVAVAQAASWPLARVSAPDTGLRSTPMGVAAWALGAAGLGLGVLFVWRGRPAVPVLVGLAGLAGVLVLAGGLLTEAGHGASYAHPTFACSVGTVMCLAVLVDLTPWRSVMGVAVAYLVGAWRTVALGAPALSAVSTEVATLVVVPLGAHVLARIARRAESGQQETARQLESAERGLRALEERERERARQYRTLHDTVLSTLSALARGTVDPAQPEIRRRLVAESDYLRGLIATSTSTAGMQFVGRLAAITREQSPTGLRVHPHISGVPDVLPEDVVEAVSGGVWEALNNVVKHSGKLEAWVTIVGTEKGGVSVTIADRGCGFDPGAARRGLGVDQSISARMKEAGGVAHVDSLVGEGTTVELEWPA